MPSRFYYQSDKEYYIQKACDYYNNNNKSSILARLKNKYDTLRDEDSVKKNEYARNWYNDLPDDKKIE